MSSCRILSLQQATVHQVPRCQSFHSVIVIIAGRAYCFLNIYIYIYIHRHVFRLFQDSSVWPGLTSDVTRVLKAPGGELWQNACGVVNEQKSFCSHHYSPECSMKKFRAYIYTYVFIYILLNCIISTY